MRISDWSSDVCSSDLGYGAGADVINNNFSTPHREFTISGSAHNAFLQTTLDLGLTGLLLFFAIFIWSIREFFRNPSPFRDGMRSEERRVGNEWVSTCSSRWSPSN